MFILIQSIRLVQELTVTNLSVVGIHLDLIQILQVYRDNYCHRTLPFLLMVELPIQFFLYFISRLVNSHHDIVIVLSILLVIVFSDHLFLNILKFLYLEKAGQWGSYGHCDLPAPTLEHLFAYLSQNDKVGICFFI